MEVARRALFSLILSASCAPPLTVSSHDLEGEAALLGYREDGAKTYQLAILRRDDPIYLTLRGELDLFLVSYPSLALPTGPLVGDPDCALLDYREVRHGRVRPEDGQLHWTSGKTPDADVDQAIFGDGLVRCTGGCWTWTEEASFEAFNDDPQFMVSRGDRVLIGSSGGRLVQVAADGVMSEVCANMQGGGDQVQGGAWNGGDEVWFGFADGRISRLSLAEQRPGTPCLSQTATVVPDRLPVQALDVSPTGEPPELFTLSSTLGGPAILRRWADGHFVQAVESPDTHPHVAQVARLSPGNAVATINFPKLLIVTPQDARPLTLNVERTGVSGADAESVISDGQGGAWLGLAHIGPFQFRLPDTLMIKRRDPAIRNVRSIARFGDRSFYLDRRAVIGQFPDHGPSCPTAPVTTAIADGADSTEAHAIAPLGRDRLVVQAADDSGVFEQLLRRRHVVLLLHRP